GISRHLFRDDVRFFHSAADSKAIGAEPSHLMLWRTLAADGHLLLNRPHLHRKITLNVRICVEVELSKYRAEAWLLDTQDGIACGRVIQSEFAVGAGDSLLLHTRIGTVEHDFRVGNRASGNVRKCAADRCR